MRVFPQLNQRAYRARWAESPAWKQIDAEPPGQTWMPFRGVPRDNRVTLLRSVGDRYRLIRDRWTGDVRYFQRTAPDPEPTLPEVVDAEPEPEVYRFHDGVIAWFIDEDNRWFTVDVKRTEKTIVLTPATGWDAERLCEWPFGEALEFPVNSPTRDRLRPLRARRP